MAPETWHTLCCHATHQGPALPHTLALRPLRTGSNTTSPPMTGAEPRPPFPSRRPADGRATPRQPGNEYPRAEHGHIRSGRPDEVHLDSLAPDRFARMTLTLMRLHFQTFAAPQSQGWLMALRHASAFVGPRAAGALCFDIVALVQALRSARRAPFRFNTEDCACCRVWLTPEERRLMALLDALRHGQTGRARTLGQMLCDGTPDDDLLAVGEVYLRRHAPEISNPADMVSAQATGECP